MKGPHIARQIGMRMLMVLDCDILMQKFSGRAWLKAGIIFKRSGLLSRLIRDHTDCFFWALRVGPFGPPALMPWAPSTPGGLGTNEAGR